jgi:hypothetical protein
MTRSWIVGLGCVLSVACGARSELRTVSGGPSDAALPDIVPDFAWYKLDETSGTVAHDSSGNHYDVWITNVTWASGAIFDGSSTCGVVNVAESFRQPPVTITAWLSPTAREDQSANGYALTPFPPNAVSGDYPGAGGYGVGLDIWTDGDAGSALAVETGHSADIAFHSLGGKYADGERRFLALVVGSADATIYVDGKQTTTTTDNITPSVTPTPLHLGCHNDDTGYGTKRFFKGIMQDARIYKRVLAPSEIAQLFTNGPV